MTDEKVGNFQKCKVKQYSITNPYVKEEIERKIRKYPETVENKSLMGYLRE